MIGEIVFLAGTTLGYAFPALVLKSRCNLAFHTLGIAITMVLIGGYAWKVGL